jgi:hypothetical protein
MRTFENPSAGKFDPPPGQERFEAPKPKIRRAWYGIPIGILYLVAKTSVRWWHPGGWLTLAPLALLVALAITDVVVSKRQGDEHERQKRYQTITR